MKRLALLFPLFCQAALGGYGGYILFQTVPAMAGSGATSPYSLLISGTYPQFATAGNGGHVVNTVTCGVNSITCPADLIFTQDSLCSSPYAGWEVISYNPATGQIAVSVLIPTLSNVRPIKIYACIGNPAVTTWQGGARGAGYDSQYLLALHMEETSGTTLHDSTANANDAIKKGALNPAPAAAGLVARAQSFLGSENSANNDYALFTTPTTATNTWTMEYWASASSWVNTDSVFLESSSGTPNVVAGYYWYPHGTILFRNSYNGISPTAPGTASAGAFHNIVFVRTGDSMNVYLDGVAGTPVSGWGTGSEQWKGLGWDGGPNGAFNSFNGLLDEVYFSAGARSADYITARYNNLSNPAGFYTAGNYTVGATYLPTVTRANSQVTIFF